MSYIAHPDTVTAQHTQRLTPLRMPTGVRYEQILAEIGEYTNILLGREPSPLQSPYLELMEVATAYHSRAREIEMEIYSLEQSGVVSRGDDLYRLRTGQLASFIEITRKCIDLGSRRLTQEQIISRMREE